MNKTYKSNFEESIARTNTIGFVCPPIVLGSNPVLTHECESRFADFLTEIQSSGDFRIHEVSASCVNLNMKLHRLIEEFFRTSVYLTSGSVRQSGNAPYFELSEKTARELLLRPMDVSKEAIAFHTWLTLPTMEILDLTLLTSLAETLKRPKLRGLICAGFPETLSFVWEPIVIGEDFLRKSGAFVG